jgi:hypothetical protein
VLYLNRRGAGDVVLRLDTIRSQSDKDTNNIVFQVNLNEQVSIRRYLDTVSEGTSIYAIVTSSLNLSPSEAFNAAQLQIESLKDSLGQDMSNKITFINFGNQAQSIYGENQLSVLINDNASPTP